MDPFSATTGVAVGTGISKLMDVALAVVDPESIHDSASNISLTKHFKNTVLTSRIYIDGTLGQDPIVADIARAAQTTYASLIMNALQIDRLVSKTQSVRELLRTVSTEHFNETLVIAADGFAKFCGSTEAEAPTAGGANLVKSAETGSFPIGRVIEVEFRNPEAAGNAPGIKINLMVQIQPYQVSSQIVGEFIRLNASPSFSQRIMQWKAGEISFMKDLILGFDIYDRRRKLLRNDTSGVLTEFLRDQVRKDGTHFSQVLEAIAVGAGRRPPKRNIANTVLVFSEESVQRVKGEIGFDLHDPADRAKYFRETYAMLIYVVDPMYNSVKLYMQGIDGVGDYSFDMFKSKGKGNEVVDLLAAIREMDKGRAPRF